VPPGLRMVRVDAANGAPALPSNKNAIWEAFIPGTEPKEGEARPVLDGSETGVFANGVLPASLEPAPAQGAESPEGGVPASAPATEGTGGLY